MYACEDTKLVKVMSWLLWRLCDNFTVLSPQITIEVEHNRILVKCFVCKLLGFS